MCINYQVATFPLISYSNSKVDFLIIDNLSQLKIQELIKVTVFQNVQKLLFTNIMLPKIRKMKNIIFLTEFKYFGHEGIIKKAYEVLKLALGF